jgi:glycerol-3-phosphate dehydrogenase
MSRAADCDAIIVGAGIQGATMAHEMARRGLRAVVLEGSEPGSANTAASFGVLHGGLRYLQRLDLARWLRSRREQSWFLREMPELAQPLPCVMPLYHGSRRSPALFRTAFLAERLAAVCDRETSLLPGGSLLAPTDVLPAYPLLRTGLIGAARWHEGLLDGRAAVGKLLATAAREARALRITAEATRLVMRGGAVTGVFARTPSGDIEVQSPTVLVCAGAATRALVAKFDRDYPQLTSAALAFNLLLAMPAPQGVALGVSPVPGRGRSLFLRAEAGQLLAGTWYAPWHGKPIAGDAIGVPSALIERALVELRACLPGTAVSREQVLAVRAGLLPDLDGSGRELREHDVFIDHGSKGGPRGLWTLLGTKLTTARALSERAATRVWPQSAVVASSPPAATHDTLRNNGRPEVHR